MDVITAKFNFWIDLYFSPLQLSEHAESLEDPFNRYMYHCDKCRCLFPGELVTSELIQDQLDGDMKWITLCICCFTGIYHNMPRWLF